MEDTRETFDFSEQRREAGPTRCAFGQLERRHRRLDPQASGGDDCSCLRD